MSLVEEIDEFLLQYNRREKEAEEYGAALSSLLHRLAGDPLIPKGDSEQVKGQSATLEVQLDRLQRLRRKGAAILGSEEKDIEEREIKVRTIILDFISGDILRKYRQISLPSSQSPQTEPTQAASAPKAPKAASTSEEETILTAIDIAKRMHPGASEKEILLTAEKLTQRVAAPTQATTEEETARAAGGKETVH